MTEDRIRSLNTLLTKASAAYYGSGEPILSDAEFDALRDELERLASASPTLRRLAPILDAVGSDVEGGGIRHLHPMLSLGNVFNADEFERWARSRATQDGNAPSGPWVVEPKLDGVSLSLVYRNGTLVQALTRGNGEVGEDVSHLAPHIAGAPAMVRRNGTLNVRGEVVILRNDFQILNALRSAEGLDPYRNPRNAASGALRLKDPGEARLRRLSFFAFEAHSEERGSPWPSHRETLSALEELGFAVVPDSYWALADTPQEARSLVGQMEANRDSLPFGVDGAVVKVDDESRRRGLGFKSRTPNWAIAWKWEEETATTTLRGVEWQVGRTGRVTPRAVLDPVGVAGAVVTYATLHNPDFIQGLDLHLGDRVEIARAGEVIPKVIRSLGNDSGRGAPIQPPADCPECGTELERRQNAGGESGVDLLCPSLLCEGQTLRRLIHFASRNAMDLDGWGEKTLEAAWSQGLLRTPSDFYRLTRADLLGLPGIAQKSADMLIASIERSKDRPLHRLLFAMGLPRVGARTSREIARSVESVDGLFDLSREALSAIDHVGEAKTSALWPALGKEEVRTEFQALRAAGVRMTEPREERAGDALGGLQIVLTGSLSRPRAEVKAWIEARGGKVTGSVTGRTSALVAGDGAGSKANKAQSLGIPIWSEEELYRRASEPSS